MSLIPTEQKTVLFYDDEFTAVCQANCREHPAEEESMSTKLMPCPFCGGEPKPGSRPAFLDKELIVYIVFCENCTAVGPAATSPNEAVGLWNKREVVNEW